MSQPCSNLPAALPPRIRVLCLAVLSAWLSGCVVGPDYHPPAPLGPPAGSTPPSSAPHPSAGSDWWRLFRDPVLDRLEAQAGAANQDLHAVVARVDRSRALTGLARSAWWPQLSLDPSLLSLHTAQDQVPPELTATMDTVPLDLSYEVDLWGKIRRANESALAGYQATVAGYYAVLLTLHGDVAVNYLRLRLLEVQTGLWQASLDLRQQAVQLNTQRFAAGLADEVELDQAREQAAQTRARLDEVQRQRRRLLAALALLCGQPAASFDLPPGNLDQCLPAIPPGLPANLLERRPDVAAAERSMAAANARIGVARAAFFPAVTLTGGAGYSSFQAASLLDWESQFFQLGPGVSLPIFNGGRLKSDLRAARADYQAACALYQQQVLVAFKDVADSLADLAGFASQAADHTADVVAAARAARLADERHQQGLVNELDVIQARQTQLAAQVSEARARALQLVATVHFIKALGGGFDPRDLLARSPASPAKSGPEHPAGGRRPPRF